MRRLGILFLLFFFGLTHVLSASNSYVDISGPADYISDAQYLQIINTASKSTDQKCCIKSVLDETQKSSMCPNDAKLFVTSNLVLGSPKAECIHSAQSAKTPNALTSEFLRPPIARS